MSHAPIDRLYSLTPRDEQSALWGPFAQNLTDAGNVVTIAVGGLGLTSSLVIPQGYVLFLDGMLLVAVPGLGQNVVSAGVGLQTAPGSTNVAIGFDQRSTALGADVVLDLKVDVDFAVPFDAGRIPIASVTFNAGVAANAVLCSFWGTVVPKGNVALFG